MFASRWSRGPCRSLPCHTRAFRNVEQRMRSVHTRLVTSSTGNQWNGVSSAVGSHGNYYDISNVICRRESRQTNDGYTPRLESGSGRSGGKITRSREPTTAGTGKSGDLATMKHTEVLFSILELSRRSERWRNGKLRCRPDRSRTCEFLPDEERDSPRRAPRYRTGVSRGP